MLRPCHPDAGYPLVDEATIPLPDDIARQPCSGGYGKYGAVRVLCPQNQVTVGEPTQYLAVKLSFER